ncbi:uncharacterized protein FIBRA_03768 [Fibroporia radiculosa]|uniref:Uncharacterized protein n=1 Tax=Fibroporia radiculosa TaxID=599839 RepID=J4H2K9_9APHY|nr:uncharacterized protein FIBRA_03768 [Fibroporia radiculosa]CCM01704.1 predicted protein [Fibroporia radiculosa]
MPTPLHPHPTNVKSEPISDAKTQMSKKQAQQLTAQAVKSKKEAIQQASVAEEKAQPPTKKVARRSSKPIINWFQRKLAGTVRARRVSEPESPRIQRISARPPSLQEKPQRRASAPMPPPISTRARSKTEPKHARKLSTVPSTAPRKPLSLDGESGVESTIDTVTDSDDGRRSSLARDSLWSPTSHYEADEDASVRPLPPSSPPSPSPSHSSSSYLSDPRTFRSMTASTKPTTLLSVDLTGGVGHIAQAPPTPTNLNHRFQPHARTHSSGPGSGGSIMFSAIPSPTIPSRPSSGNSINTSLRAASHSYTLQAPQHTSHHPRNNPRPSSPPQDDASVLTLASSAFGMPGARIGMAALALSGHGSLADDSLSHLSHGGGQGDSTSHFVLGDMDDERQELEGERDLYREEQDVDASVRALRPRSSRRCSWESQASKWSASASVALTGVTGFTSHSPISHGGQRSLWTTGSYRTGGISVDHGEQSVDHGDDEEDTEGNGDETEGGGDETSQDDHGVQEISSSVESGLRELDQVHAHDAAGALDDARTPPATSCRLDVPKSDDGQFLEVPSIEPSQSSKSTTVTPKGGPIPLQEPEAMPGLPHTMQVDSVSDSADTDHDSHSDFHSIATTEYYTDTFHTPATTPLPQ